MNNTYNARPIWMLMAVLSFVVAMFVGTGAQASVIDSTPFVDKITSSKSEFQPREIAEIGMEFSEKPGQKFKPGDELVLPLPAEFKGFPNTMMLEDYAQVFVEQGQVRIVFTDKVTKKNHVKGMVKFSIKASETVEAGTSKDVRLDLGTNANPFPSVKVHGYPVRNEGSGNEPREAAPFGYKGGNINDNDSTLIDWYIVINADRLNVNTKTVVRDTLGKGHEYVAGSITIDGRPVTAEDGQLVMNGNSFELTLNPSAVDGKTVGLKYQTRITEAGKKMKTFKNDFKLDFQLPNQAPNAVEGGANVNNVLMTGVIEGDEEEVHEGKEEVTEGMTEETVSEVTETTDEHAIDCVEEDHAHEHVDVKVNEIRVTEAVETMVEETLDEVAEVVEDHGSESVEANEVNEKAEVTEVDVRVAEVEEVAPEKTEKVTEVEVVAPEADKKAEVKTNKSEEKVATKSANKTAELPQTGSSDNKLVAVLGVALLMFAGLLIRRRSGK